MSILPASSIGDESTGFYNGVATQSLRFDDGSSDHLTFTPGSASSAADRRKITHAVWIKRGNIGTYQSIYSSTKSGGGDYYLWRFNNDDTMTIFLDVDDSNFAYDGTEVYRDTMNWYHFVLIIDTTQSSASNRIKLYANGVQQTLSNKYGSDVSQNFETYVMDGTEDAIGEFNFNSTTYFDGYMCDFITTIGQSNSISDFGETKNGVWIAKNYSGSYGANGFRLEFKQTGTGTASTSTIGADTSGNTNHWTSNNLASADSNFPDSPENNLAVWNRLVYRRTKNFVPVFSQGNTKVNGTSSQVAHTSSTIASTGKHYAEFYINNASKAVTSCGVVRTLWDGGLGQSYAGNYSGAYYATNGTRAYNATSDSQTAPGSDRVGIEVDFANNEVEFFTVASDGTRTSRGGKLDGSDGIEFDGEGVFTATTHDVSTSYIEAYFSETSWNGTPNSGYEELSASKLSDLTISPAQSSQADDHFNTLLWSGNNSYPRALTGVGFQPDLVWTKTRNQAYGHGWFDSSRGASAGAISSQNTINEPYANTNFDLDSFDSDGMTWASTADLSTSNNSGDNYVAWNWKANGGTTTTNDASSTGVGTIDSVFQANTTSGFSIVTYTGTGSAGTVKHGLSVAPSMVIIKSRSGGSVPNWVIGQDQSGFTGQLYFDTGMFSSNSGSFNNTAPTTSVVSIGTDSTVNQNTINYVMYCFSNVEGFSRVGSYTGNGRTDGPFIYTSFRPAWLMLKRTGPSGTSGWSIFDNKRDTFNPVDTIIQANSGGAESTSYPVDFLSNGFKLRTTDSTHNQSGSTFIFLAFAEQSFKFSNAR